MSDDSFNPYHEWLGLDRRVTQPNFYQLLGLDPGEQSLPRIAEAGERAMAQARGCRPGNRGAQWAKMLEEITAAASCLSDPIRRAEYDRQLGRGGTGRSFNRPAPRSQSTPIAGTAPAATSLPQAASGALPMQAPQGIPAAYGHSPTGPTAYPNPMAPLAPTGPTATPARGGYGSPAASARRTATGEMLPTAVPLRPMPATPAAVPVPVSGPDRRSPAKVRPRPKTSNVTVIAVSAGIGMMVLAGAIMLVIFSQQPPDRGGSTYGSFAQNRPIVNGSRSSAPAPLPPTDPSTAATERMAGQVEVPAESRVGPPRESSPREGPAREGPPQGTPAAEMPPTPLNADNTLRLPAFPAAPTLPSPDAILPPQTQSPTAGESLIVPSQPSAATPDGVMSPPAMSEPGSGPASGTSDTKLDPLKPREASTKATAVSPEEVAALAKTLQAAHAAIVNREYDAAEAELNKVASLPKLPLDHAKYERLTLWAGYAKNFQAALQRAVAGLHPGDDIEVGSSTVVGFVSADKDSITLRVSGTNRTYALDRLPAGLAVAIADRWMKKDDAASLAMKGAYVAALKDLDEERKAKAREWLQEASRRGIQGELHKVLDDRYD